MKKLLILAAALMLLGCEDEKQEPKPVARVKRVVRLTAMSDKFFELDDGARYGMGENLYNRVVSRLQQNGNFVVLVNEPWGPKALNRAAPETPEFDPSDRLHFDWAPVAAADFSAEVGELSFTHGSRGVKRYAGFNDSFRTPFNDGSFESRNEFPARNLDFVTGWFGTTFEALGGALDSTILGVDAGEEGEFNLVIAKLNYRRDSYHATAKVATRLHLLAENEIKERLLDASGKGFLFAIGAGYRELSVEFGVARKNALQKTFDSTVERVVSEVESQLAAIPFRTKIEKYGEQGIIINAGRREGIRLGDIFLHKANGAVSVLQVVESFHVGSRVDILSSPTDLREQDVIVFDEKASPSVTKTKRSAASLPQPTIPREEIPENRQVASQPAVKHEIRGITIDPPEFVDPDGNIAKALTGKGALLPLLLWRWTQYDQEIKTESLKPRGDVFKISADLWNLKSIRVAEAWKDGLTGKGVKIAVIDSGVDYNHENLAHALPRTYAGFDFVSHDLRPFDDNSHGTAVAGILAANGTDGKHVGVAPDVTLLSYKVFNPYGETSSAALYGAVERAIQEGAKILLLAWDTRRESKALESAMRLAENKGVLVVTAAGDQGEDIRSAAHYPARYNALPNLLVVANLDESGKLSTENKRWSNWGPGAVDIAAPGSSLDALAPRSNYLKRSGSDLAAAHVAGAAALVWQAYPGATAKEIKDKILIHSKRDSSLSGQVTEGRILDAAAATR